ncbi:Prophage endopeptidase tail [Macrococcoides caseolyticum]|uniref:phage tail spike protein n=1 Tax=Macrococcoides caseolyticum TaxID=69966 RepID=UPI000A28E47B|nr:phage tail spike protein [Macrococcus caseolyticus]ARQ04684.1 Prophage endopeptidase tail [Macrococcus caseolyticus]
MYKIILTNATNDNQKVVWDVKQDIKLLRSASMQKQEDGIDSVSISPVHNFVENSATFIQPYNTLIEIINEKTDVIEFKGRVLSPESEMTDSGLFTHELIFEGAEAYLKDSIQSYSFEFDKMPVENLKKVIAHHNNELKNEAYKHFKVGNVTVEKNIIPSDENYNEELKYFKRSDDKDTYETLMDLKEKYGGTFIFEPTNDVTLVHWLKETGNLTNTVIKIGKNLKSIQKKFDASEVITRLKPLGASSETANGDEIKLTIAEVNNGSPYIDIPQLIKLFGIQTGTVTFDDKHTPETLKKAAEDWIKEHEKKQARISLSLDALDLSYLKLDPDEFKIYNKHRVICPPLNIDEDLKIISIKVDLLKPYDKEVSFGERELGYAELEKERSIKNTNLIINKTVPGIIDRQTGGINRDVMVLNDYKITFEDLKLHQSNLLDEVNQILNSEYLVDDEVRADLLSKAQNVESLSNTIKDALESADERTINATKLVALQNKMNAYRTSLKSFVIAKEGAKISLLKRLQILQSQYTEKKFSDAMETVAKTLPNGKWNADTKTLTSDIPNQAKLDSIVNDLKLFVNNQDNALETKIGKSVDAKIVDTKNEFTRQFTEVNSKVDKLSFENRNLLLNTNKEYPKPSREFLQTEDLAVVFDKYPITQKYSLSFDMKATKQGNVTVYMQNGSGTKYNFVYDTVLATTEYKRFKFEGLSPSLSNTNETKAMLAFYSVYDSGVFPIVRNIKLELGNKATPYSIAPEDIDKSINDVKVRVKTVEGGLTATNKKFETVYSKTETEQLLNSNLQPIKTDVNNTKSSIEQLDKEVKSKVSQTIYSTDQENVVKRLNSADTERQQLSNQIADRVTLTEYNSGIEAIEQNTDQKLSTMKTETLQDGKKISQEVSQQIYNASSKTLNQTLSQYINSISTGHQFTYDENGNISDFTVGSSGIKLNARVIDMNDGDVTIQNGITTIKDAYIDKLFSKQATINYLDAIGITARTLQAKDKQASVNIENGSITMNRDSGARMDIGLDGIQSFNAGGSLRFSLTPTLVTTSAVGTSVSNVYLGAAPTGEARIVDMSGIPGDGAIGSYSYRPLRTLAIKFPLKANGYIGIDGNELRIMSDGLVEGGYKDVRAAGFFGNTLDVNTYANGTHLYLRPTRDGEVKFTNIGTTDVYTNTRAGGTYTTFVDFNGHATGGHLYLRPKGGHEVKLTYTGTTDQFASLRSNGIYVPWIDYNGKIPGSHLYIRPGSGGEVRFTKTGTTDQFINIKANDGDFNQISYNKWVQKSREEWKTGIRKWKVNASEVLTNEVDIYEFYYKNDLDYLTRGSVIGDGYKVPDFWLSKSKNGIDNTSVIWTLAKALQEQIEKNNDLENRLKILEDKLNG